MSSPPDQEVPPEGTDRAGLLRRLREQLAGLERLETPDQPVLALGAEALDRHLPRGGLGLGTLHQVAPQTYGDGPAAFGFAAALAGRMAHLQPGPVLLVCARAGLADFGAPYGPGLAKLGLDPGRVILTQAGPDADALWALEEIVRARAASAVIGCLARGPDLKASRRLHLAGAGSAALVLLLTPHRAEEASAAATRWRVQAAPAGRDRFGIMEHPVWDIALMRARNGRPGAWRVEWDHVAYRFSLARPLAGPEVLPRAREAPARRTG